jgi:hypothetical protein
MEAHNAPYRQAATIGPSWRRRHQGPARSPFFRRAEFVLRVRALTCSAWALSSVGRASPLQGEGRGTEARSAHVTFTGTRQPAKANSPTNPVVGKPGHSGRPRAPAKWPKWWPNGDLDAYRLAQQHRRQPARLLSPVRVCNAAGGKRAASGGGTVTRLRIASSGSTAGNQVVQLPSVESQRAGGGNPPAA